MIYKLGDLLREICVKTTKNNEYPVLTSSKSGIFLQEDYFTKTVASKDNTGYKIIKRGQFTYRSMSDSGDFFINCLTACDIGIVSPAYPVFEIVDENVLNREFLIHFFRSTSFNKKISNLSKGSTRLSLKYKDLKNIEIDVPPMERQKAIASALDGIYGEKNKFENVKSDLEQFKTKYFVELFVNKDYPAKELGSIADISSGDSLTSPSISPILDEKNRYLVYGANGVRGYYSSANRHGECIMVGRVGALAGNVHYYSGDFFATEHALVVEVKTKDVYPEWLSYDLARRDLFSIAKGAAQPVISSSNLKKEIVYIPPLNLQNYYLEIAHQIDKMIQITEKNIALVQELLEVKMEEYFE